MTRSSSNLRSFIVRAHFFEKRKPADIWRGLQREAVAISLNTVHNIIRRFHERGNISDAPRRAKPLKLRPEHLRRIDELTVRDREMTSVAVQKVLLNETGVLFGTSTIRKARRKLDWKCQRSRFAQCIRRKNQLLRVVHARKVCSDKETYNNVVFTDECTVEMDNHSRIYFRRKGEKPVLKGRPKHPYKLHIWAGISMRGATDVVLFEGIMKKEFYVDILKTTLVPFGEKVFPDGYRLMQDNDPKHTSAFARDYFKTANIVWWKTPPESPDLNPIEKVWHELKHFLRSHHKPTTKDQLVDGILLFWRQRVTPEKCRRYISNLRKALPLVVENKGRATGL